MAKEGKRKGKSSSPPPPQQEIDTNHLTTIPASGPTSAGPPLAMDDTRLTEQSELSSVLDHVPIPVPEPVTVTVPESPRTSRRRARSPKVLAERAASPSSAEVASAVDQVCPS